MARLGVYLVLIGIIAVALQLFDYQLLLFRVVPINAITGGIFILIGAVVAFIGYRQQS